MNAPSHLQLAGAAASPYTQKMAALLRYRRIRYALRWGDPSRICEELGVDKPRPTLLPTFFMEEDGQLRARCDSTPIIRHLESLYSGRSVIPKDPPLAFIDYLVEDFADEWCTKFMFHYRWSRQTDADNAGTLLPLGTDVSMAGSTLAQAKAAFSARQIARLYVVGSNRDTAPIIEASYRRFLRAMEKHLASQPFVLGSRPCAGDFALHGQLSQLVGFDPTPRAIAHELSPRTVAWVDLMRDLSGLEVSDDDWISLEDQPDTLRDLLGEIGRVYAPAQLANAQALAAGADTWEAEIDGAAWQQPAFPYQAKCLQWTNDAYRAMSAADRARADRMLAGTGIGAMLTCE